MRFAAQQRLAVEATRLDGYLARFEYLPSLLDTSPGVFRLLDDPGNAALQQTVSLYLKSINLLAGADNLYVLGVAGETLAAADFEKPGTSLCNTKLCVILYAYELDRRLRRAGISVSSIAYDPGFLLDAGMGRSALTIFRYPAIKFLMGSSA